MSDEEPIDRYLRETRGQRATTGGRPGDAMNRNEAIMHLEAARVRIRELEAKLTDARGMIDTQSDLYRQAQEEREQLKDRLEVSQRSFAVQRKETLTVLARLERTRAQLDTERKGALAREEATLEAQWFGRLAWEFIQESCVGDEIEADIGAEGSPERELYLKWCIVRLAADERAWLKEETPEEEPAQTCPQCPLPLSPCPCCDEGLWCDVHGCALCGSYPRMSLPDIVLGEEEP